MLNLKMFSCILVFIYFVFLQSLRVFEKWKFNKDLIYHSSCFKWALWAALIKLVIENSILN